ncbi:MAG: hypothetical protein ACFFEL_06905 [Candidatus Thorarchaeota archaeon]
MRKKPIPIKIDSRFKWKTHEEKVDSNSGYIKVSTRIAYNRSIVTQRVWWNNNASAIIIALTILKNELESDGWFLEDPVDILHDGLKAKMIRGNKPNSGNMTICSFNCPESGINVLVHAGNNTEQANPDVLIYCISSRRRETWGYSGSSPGAVFDPGLVAEELEDTLKRVHPSSEEVWQMVYSKPEMVRFTIQEVLRIMPNDFKDLKEIFNQPEADICTYWRIWFNKQSKSKLELFKFGLERAFAENLLFSRKGKLTQIDHLNRLVTSLSAFNNLLLWK